MFCIKCGAELKRGTCPSCGHVDKTYKRSKKRLYIIIAAVAVVVLGAGSFLAVYLIKDAKYNEAIDYLKDDRPEKAAEGFEELNDFMGSKEYLDQANDLIEYYDAVEEYEDKEYEKALDLFEELGKFGESKEYAQKCRDNISYNEAEKLFDEGKYETAMTIYNSLGDFKDSAARLLFESLSGYEDSDNMASVCSYMTQYDDAAEMYNRGDYANAAELLLEVEYAVTGTVVDFPESFALEELKYIQGQCYYNMEFYASAYNAFVASGDYEDASYVANKCEQPIETGELFRDDGYSSEGVKVTLSGPVGADYNVFVVIHDYDSNNEEIVSMCLIEHDEKLTVYIPSGVYVFKVYYGKTWYGYYERFGKSSFDDWIHHILEHGQEITLDLHY